MRRATTRREGAAYLRERFEDATRAWKIGDACLSYRGHEQTRVAKVEGDRITLANGEMLHRSKMRRVREVKR